MTAATALHILKLCVGCDSVADLLEWHRINPSSRPDGLRRHVTRMWPKREEEILAGGSLYWVIRGQILCRQQILGFEEVDEGDGIRRCGLLLAPKLVRTETAQRRPFQGWRYLAAADAPRDLAERRSGEESLPPGMAEALAAFGVR